jgi:aryl-alcohol dehydrogenase-like predicted oxidoreductase
MTWWIKERRYIGCSNYRKLTEAVWVSRLHNLTRFESLQPHYNLVRRAEFEREHGRLPRLRPGGNTNSPLAGGFLTGKYRPDQVPESARRRGAQRYFSETNWALLEQMGKIGQEKGRASISQIALAWLLTDPLVTSPIIGPRSLEQLQDNVGAVGLRLEAEEKKMLDDATHWKD